MPMKVEAAIVTQKRPLALYNTDSVNVNGKVMPREVIKNGYKGSGILSGNVYFALTSSGVEGFADATVAAFNDRAELFSRSREPMSVFSGFFEDCRGALLNMNRSADELVSAGFYASGRKAVIANNGNTRIYLQRLGVTTPVTTEKVADTTADFSGAVFSDVCEGDIFILLSPGAAQALGDKEIEDILRISDGSVKKIVNYILKVAFASDGDKAVSAIVVKVLETALEEEIPVPAFVPDFGEEKKVEETVPVETADPVEEPADTQEDNAVEEAVKEEDTTAEEASAQEDADAVEENADKADEISSIFAKNALEMFEEADLISETQDAAAELYTEEIDSVADADEEPAEETEAVTEESENKKSRTPLFIILGIMFAISVILIIVFAVVPAFSGNSEETTIEETTTEEETSEETTADEESTSEETTEEETEEETSSEETTTKRASQETTTRRPSAETTTRPVTENTTSAPVVAPEETTAASEEPEATTAEEEKTTAEETTAEETTSATEENTVAENTTAEATKAEPEETEAVQ